MKRQGNNSIKTESNITSLVLEKARSRRLPILGSIELTRRCNVRCPYCYVGFARDTRPEDELSREELFSIFDQIAAEGCLFLTFTGGEPLCRDDFRSIYQYALRKGFLITIFTNGTLIDRETADYLARYPPFYIEITIFGASEETYERVSGIRGSFRQCREALRLLDERDLFFGLKSVISTLNRKEVWEMKAFAEGMGKTFRFDTLICPQLNGSHHGTRYRLSPEEIVHLDQQVPEKWDEWKEFACRQWGPINSDRLYKCGGGLYSFHISSSGELGLCVLDTNYRYNLIKGNFKEGWENFIPWTRKRKNKERNRCRDCEIIAICGNCPAWSILETGSPEKPVEFLCQIAQLRGILLKENRSKHYEEETIPQA